MAKYPNYGGTVPKGRHKRVSGLVQRSFSALGSSKPIKYDFQSKFFDDEADANNKRSPILDGATTPTNRRNDKRNRSFLRKSFMPSSSASASSSSRKGSIKEEIN